MEVIASSCHQNSINYLGERKTVMKYEEPNMEIIVLSTSEVIVTSGLGDDPDSERNDKEDW